MAKRQIATKREIYDNCPAGKDFPEKHICTRIQPTEEAFLRGCFGPEFYEAMLEALTDVSGAVEWVCGTYYEADEIVLRNEYYYTALQKSSVDPANKNEVGFWERTGKFTDDCWNTLWEDYLLPIIANKVYSKAAPFSIVQSSAGGLIVHEKDNRDTRAANSTEVMRLQQNLAIDIADFMANMKAWMNEEEQKDCFPVNPFTNFCGPDCTVVSRGTSRKFFFDE